MKNQVTVSHKEGIRLNAESRELKMLLKRAKTTIDHARKWRINTDSDFQDDGMYRKVSEEIEQKLSNG